MVRFVPSSFAMRSHWPLNKPIFSTISASFCDSCFDQGFLLMVGCSCVVHCIKHSMGDLENTYLQFQTLGWSWRTHTLCAKLTCKELIRSHSNLLTGNINKSFFSILSTSQMRHSSFLHEHQQAVYGVQCRNLPFDEIKWYDTLGLRDDAFLQSFSFCARPWSSG